MQAITMWQHYSETPYIPEKVCGKEALAIPKGNIQRCMHCKNLHNYEVCNITSGLQIQNTF
jgi:recombinational DNA repair protein RecR